MKTADLYTTAHQMLIKNENARESNLARAVGFYEFIGEWDVANALRIIEDKGLPRPESVTRICRYVVGDHPELAGTDKAKRDRKNEENYQRDLALGALSYGR